MTATPTTTLRPLIRGHSDIGIVREENQDALVIHEPADPELLGKKGMPQGANQFPPIDTALVDGEVGFKQHTGGHTDAPTWPTFLAFAERFIAK